MANRRKGDRRMAISDNEFKLIISKLDEMKVDIDRLFTLIEKNSNASLLNNTEIGQIKQKIIKYDNVCDEHIVLKTKIAIASWVSGIAIAGALSSLGIQFLKLIFTKTP